MLALLISVISVVLTIAITTAAMSYVGDTAGSADAGVTAATVANQAAQLSALLQIRSFRASSSVASLEQLVSENYLSEIPLPPTQAYATGLVSYVSDWVVVQPARVPLIIIQDKLRQDVCANLNKQLGYSEEIPAQLMLDRRIQCFGTSEPYTLAVSPSGNHEVIDEAINYWNAAFQP